VCRVRGALLADMGDVAGAEAQFLDAIRIARDQGARHWELRAATGLARLWHNQGKRRKAHDLLAPVCASFAEESGTPDVERARALINELL
jgi:predicted ATPase